MAGKPAVLTRVVDSMTDNLRPTRAEATDVANAVLDGKSLVIWCQLGWCLFGCSVVDIGLHVLQQLFIVDHHSSKTLGKYYLLFLILFCRFRYLQWFSFLFFHWCLLSSVLVAVLLTFVYMLPSNLLTFIRWLVKSVEKYFSFLSDFGHP